MATTGENERLKDLVALRDAIKTQRDATSRLCVSRGYRKKRLRNVIERVRSLRVALAQAVKELIYLRGCTNGVIGIEIDGYDNRIKELDRAILHQTQRVRIERLHKLSEQMNALGAELPPELLAEMTGIAVGHGGEDPDTVDEEMILS